MPPRNIRKALLPFMSNVTLLCIAVAFSLATLAWTNGLPTANMYSEDLHVVNYKWGPNRAYIDVTLYNNGTQSVRLRSVTVNSQPAAVLCIAGPRQISRGESVILRVATSSISGAAYQIVFQTAKGNRFVYTAAVE